ncbi:hypothetical protein Tco_0910383 [Tanacetum coccineum]|uniref:Uncharacterized protein n=1 Tax=Tanacetum coccineum TaxID=301880 RepID=A0ABQ5CV11_9ASTR
MFCLINSNIIPNKFVAHFDSILGRSYYVKSIADPESLFLNKLSPSDALVTPPKSQPRSGIPLGAAKKEGNKQQSVKQGAKQRWKSTTIPKSATQALGLEIWYTGTTMPATQKAAESSAQNRKDRMR